MHARKGVCLNSNFSNEASLRYKLSHLTVKTAVKIVAKIFLKRILKFIKFGIYISGIDPRNQVKVSIACLQCLVRPLFNVDNVQTQRKTQNRRTLKEEYFIRDSVYLRRRQLNTVFIFCIVCHQQDVKESSFVCLDEFFNTYFILMFPSGLIFFYLRPKI